MLGDDFFSVKFLIKAHSFWH